MLIEAHGPLWSESKWSKSLSLLTVSRTEVLLFSASPFAAEVLGGCRSGRAGVPAVVEVSS